MRSFKVGDKVRLTANAAYDSGNSDRDNGIITFEDYGLFLVKWPNGLIYKYHPVSLTLVQNGLDRVLDEI